MGIIYPSIESLMMAFSFFSCSFWLSQKFFPCHKLEEAAFSVGIDEWQRVDQVGMKDRSKLASTVHLPFAYKMHHINK